MIPNSPENTDFINVKSLFIQNSISDANGCVLYNSILVTSSQIVLIFCIFFEAPLRTFNSAPVHPCVQNQ
jgi:hypothetical protein